MDGILADMLAGVSEHRPEIIATQLRVVRKDFIFAPADRKQFQQEVHGQTCAANHRLACENGRVRVNALPPVDAFPLGHGGKFADPPCGSKFPSHGGNLAGAKRESGEKRSR